MIVCFLKHVIYIPKSDLYALITTFFSDVNFYFLKVKKCKIFERFL